MRESQLGVGPPLPPGVYWRRPTDELPFPLGEEDSCVFARARHGLWQGVQALGLRPGDGLLVPAYHHGSEVEALLRAGLLPTFYEAGAALAPDPEELDSLLAPHVRALYMIHYLGFPQDTAQWRAWCDERGLLLLEDAGQAWLATDASGPVGSLGDLAIFCLYKMVGVPDGGALVVRAPTPRPETARPWGLASLGKRHGLWAVQRSSTLAGLASRVHRDGRYDPEEDFALGDAGSAPTAATLALLPRLADGQVAAGRRANYQFLLDELGEYVPPPFVELPPGACPFAFPVETDRKDELLARLAARGVEPLDFWSVAHPALPPTGFPAARARRERTVALPVHQELQAAHLERIADAVRPSHRRPRQLRLEPIASFEEAGREWDELAAQSQNVFATREWITLWWRHFGRGKRLLLTACRSPTGELVAIFPLYVQNTGGVCVLRLLGHGTADQLGPICAPEDRLRAARMLRRFLDERLVPWDFFLGELLPGDQPWSRLLGARALGRDGYPILRFEHATWAEYEASRGRHFRKRAAQAERRLSDQHEVRFRLADDPARIAADLDTLFRLHRTRWTDEQSPFGAHEAFHRELAERALQRGWLYLWLLELDNEPVAAEYTFRFADTQNHYQSGRHPDWEYASIGSLLFTYTVRKALEDGIRECRFLRGREEYKYRLSNVDPELETIAAAHGPLGEVALAATAALRSRLQVQWVRHWLAE
jgi:dTDP-4-amino-4,6-dideoxygalactose transaminase/CelD/BcsL family acetyltransferase involved in cellulose biosynthesis